MRFFAHATCLFFALTRNNWLTSGVFLSICNNKRQATNYSTENKFDGTETVTVRELNQGATVNTNRNQSNSNQTSATMANTFELLHIAVSICHINAYRTQTIR